jgi:hypothetical protein
MLMASDLVVGATTFVDSLEGEITDDQQLVA